MIDYARIIPSFIGPKLAYHGFKYDETESYPPQGSYFFSRKYWGTTQRVSLGPVWFNREDAKAVISRKEDFPTEVPSALLLIEEPGFRLWLSNRYITALLYSEHRSIYLLPTQGIYVSSPPVDEQEFMIKVKSGEIFQPGRRLPIWWEFNGADDLRRVLGKVAEQIVTDGLDWFEDQVHDIKQYHQKLERRRLSAKRTKKS